MQADPLPDVLIRSTALPTDVLSSAVTSATQAPMFNAMLKDTSHRILHAQGAYLSGSKMERNAFHVPIVDYTNGRTIWVSSEDAFDSGASVSFEITNDQPLPTPEELQDAAEIAGFGSDAEVQSTMPAIIPLIYPNGTSARVLNIMARRKGSIQAEQAYVF